MMVKERERAWSMKYTMWGGGGGGGGSFTLGPHTIILKHTMFHSLASHRE